ncbi:flagellar hook-length control protein FliK [Brevibacillus massiliensis]|jgi:flagellar hook-length control protein FliK|uniref:flagellar hook-length control protein FliK n=1 Tax=Brevibacillus massiliensis TaxID=1118054 RepID=UPI0002F666A2|nr:flagellar hook-length control protein FliK [Brevibacillus massiliensis]
MNVMMTTPAVPGSMPGLPGEKGQASTPTDLLGMLFALQLGSALQNADETDQTGELLPLQDEPGEEQMEMLLALLQQSLAGGEFDLTDDLQPAKETANLLPLQQLDHAGGQQAAPNPVLPEQLLQLLRAAEQPEQQSSYTQILQLLQASAKEGQPVHVSQSLTGTDQLKLLLGQLGFEVNKSEPEGNQVPTAKQNASKGTGYQLFMPAVLTGSTANANLQPMRVNQALLSYQAQAATQVRQPAVNLTQANGELAKIDPKLAEQPDSSANPAPAAPTPASTGQQFVSGAASSGAAVYQTRGDHLAQDVSNLFVKQMKLENQDGISHAKLLLYPRSLGQVDVRIIVHNGLISAQFLADSKAGKELLDNQLPQLRAALVQQGLQVDRLEVLQQQQQPSYDFQQQEGRRQQTPERQQQPEEETEVFSLDNLLEEADEAQSGTLRRV